MTDLVARQRIRDFVRMQNKPTSSQKQLSGFLFPTIGESNNRGYSVQNGGYYLALSQYYDVALTGDYFSNGSYGFRLDSKYLLIYNFSGSLSMRFENLISGERGIPDYSKSTVFNVRWNHAKDPKATPNSNFSASVISFSELFSFSS